MMEIGSHPSKKYTSLKCFVREVTCEVFKHIKEFYNQPQLKIKPDA